MVEHGRLRAKAALPEPRAEQIIGSHPVYAGGEGFALSFHLALHPGSVACRRFEAPSALLVEPDVFHAPAIDHAVDHHR
jgi:hypothetical protein